ncbi:MAG TPA: DUF2200 domain-containing protein [Candidatus Thermoplasmatota archaeon]|nr:DUF2200 domain-containing protein [Candidatus Thermoplasmatota archaeon]
MKGHVDPQGKPRIYTTPFASVYPLYVQKVERKGRTKAEVDEVVCWLTGHTPGSLQKAIASGVDLETFFATCPRYNAKAELITGVVCGVRVEDIDDPTMKRIRQLDKLVDEIAKGKPLAKVLRA